MPRQLAPGTLAAFSNPVGFYPITLIESVWPDGVARVHSHVGPLEWDGETWGGIGNFVNDVQIGPETGGLVPPEASMTIGGVVETVLSYANPAARGGRVRLWIGALTAPNVPELVDDPYLAFEGYLDSADAFLTMTPDGIDAALNVGVGTGPPPRDFASITHSTEDQQRSYPTDTGYDRNAYVTRWNLTPDPFPNPKG